MNLFIPSLILSFIHPFMSQNSTCCGHPVVAHHELMDKLTSEVDDINKIVKQTDNHPDDTIHHTKMAWDHVGYQYKGNTHTHSQCLIANAEEQISHCKTSWYTD